MFNLRRAASTIPSSSFFFLPSPFLRNALFCVTLAAICALLVTLAPASPAEGGLSPGVSSVPAAQPAPAPLQAAPGLDHFKCYPVQRAAQINASVFLADQFTEADAHVLTTGEFCNPVEKTHIDPSGTRVVTPIKDADAHLKFYRIDSTEQPTSRRVAVRNQFGQRVLKVSAPLFLAVPTQKTPQEFPETLDHYKCYRATGNTAGTRVDLTDQFNSETNVGVREPFLFCNPVEKTHNDVVIPIRNDKDHLVCYRIDGATFTATVETSNQFGTERLTVSPANLLCVPSEKLAVGVPPPVVVIPVVPPILRAGVSFEATIVAEEAINVAGVQFILLYDPAVLALQGEPQLSAELESDCTLIANTQTQGQLIAVIACTEGHDHDPILGHLPLMTAQFMVRQVTQGTTTELVVKDEAEGDLVVSDPQPVEIDAIGGSAALRVAAGRCGDLTGDLQVNVLDGTLGLRGIVNLVRLTPAQLFLGDVTQDGNFNIGDVVFILRHIVGLTEIIGCGKPTPTPPVAPGELRKEFLEGDTPAAAPPVFVGCRSITPDFVVTGSESGLGGEHCFPSNQDGTFQPRSNIPGLRVVDGMDVADFDRDGDNDFMACDGTTGEVYLYTQGPVGTFTPSVVANQVTSRQGSSFFCTYLREGDFNRDGLKEFVVGDNRVANRVWVYLQATPQTFPATFNRITALDVSWASPAGGQCNCLFAIAVGDVDEDGNPDVLLLGYTGAGAGQVRLYKGNGVTVNPASALLFNVRTDFPVVANPTGLALFDLNQDTHLDIVVGGSGDGSHYFYLGDGAGNFTTPAGPAFDINNFSGIDSYDIDRDGRQDLMVVDWSTRRLLFFRNLGGALAAPVNVTAADPAGPLAGNSIGVGAPQPEAGPPTRALDHFKCYQTQDQPIDVPVILRDQFGSGEALVLEPQEFCNPVSKIIGEIALPILNPDAHLKFYRIQTQQRGVTRVVQVSNQFGEDQTLTVSAPQFLAVPTQKIEPRFHPPPVGLDHFQCYKAEGATVERSVGLRDQFFESQVLVLAPLLLCNPVEKTHAGKVTPIQDPKDNLDHLVCYQIQGADFTGTVQVENQFGGEVLSLQRANLLCVPSEKDTLVQDPNIQQMCGDRDAVGFDGGMVLPGGPGTGLYMDTTSDPPNTVRRPCGEFVPIDGFLPSGGVNRFRIAYREAGTPVPAVGTALGVRTRWVLRDRTLVPPFCTFNVAHTLETDADGWMDTSDYLESKLGGPSTDFCANSGLVLGVWDTDNNMGFGPADPNGHYVLWLEWEDGGGVLHKEPFEHHIQLDNTLPEISPYPDGLQVRLTDGTTIVPACGEAQAGVSEFQVWGQFRDDYYWDFRLALKGGVPPASVGYGPHAYYDPDDGTAGVKNTDDTGTTPDLTTVHLRNIDMNDLGESFQDCCYLMDLWVRDAAIRHSFNNRVANDNSGSSAFQANAFITFAAGP